MVFRKSQKISTASDQYFLSYVKKTTGGGLNWFPKYLSEPFLLDNNNDNVDKILVIPVYLIILFTCWGSGVKSPASFSGNRVT